MTKRMRLHSKQPPPPPTLPPRFAQMVQVGCPDYASEENSKAYKRGYLVTFPHPRASQSSQGRQLVAPESMSKQALLEKLLDACARPIYTDTRSKHRESSIIVEQAGLFFELHQEDEAGIAHKHGHGPLLAFGRFRFLPVKRALLERFGLASHWSCSHDGYWSMIRYLFVPSPKKPAIALDREPALWASHGPHPPLQECCHEPLTAAASAARRLKVEHKAAAEGKQEPRVTEFDVFPIVVRNGFKNTSNNRTAHLELIDFAKRACSTGMQAFLFKIRARLSTLIDDIWQWETVGEMLVPARRTRLEAMDAAMSSPCVCGGAYMAAILASLLANKIDTKQLCSDIMAALYHGRCERLPTLVLAGLRGGEGKSLMLKALFVIFGVDFVFAKPEIGNFPLVDLPGKKVAFLDDWRLDESVLSYSTQCLWYDGSALPITRPQNQAGVQGHLLYQGDAPIFVTTKLKDIIALRQAAADDPNTGCPRDAEASMILRRLKVYEFNARIAKPSATLKYCGHCFASLVLNESGVV